MTLQRPGLPTWARLSAIRPRRFTRVRPSAPTWAPIPAPSPTWAPILAPAPTWAPIRARLSANRPRAPTWVATVAVALLLAACGAGAIEPGAARPLPPHAETAIDTSPKERRRMVPPEVYLRAYLAWFGGLAPLAVQAKARGKGLFDAWDDYLAALGLPDYRIDLPRQTQTNTLMLATFGRLGEALCARAAEHDLHDKRTPPDQRIVFAFEPIAAPTDAQFAERFDVLHRTFLGYPAALAPPDREARFYALYRGIAAHHTDRKKPALTADETAWAAVCGALVQHPEAELY